MAGLYFLTICAQDRGCLFGEIAGSKIRLDDAGKMIDKWWNELGNKFQNIELDEYVIMPNHVHGVIQIMQTVGADLRVCPNDNQGEHIGSPLHKTVQWFKTMTTNEYIRHVKNNNWSPFNGKLWQRNYYEHIIRNERELNKIEEYIIHNPLKWELDFENPSRKKEYKDFTGYLEENLNQRIPAPN